MGVMGNSIAGQQWWQCKRQLLPPASSTDALWPSNFYKENATINQGMCNQAQQQQQGLLHQQCSAILAKGAQCKKSQCQKEKSSRIWKKKNKQCKSNGNSIREKTIVLAAACGCCE